MLGLLVTGCAPTRPPPPRVIFGGIPASGSLRDAQKAGFTTCFQPDAVHMRCSRHGLMLVGTGPYEAAVDLVGGDGSGGFDQVTLWHKTDQYAVYAITDVLEKQGWKHCSTATAGGGGDQIIYTRAGAPVRVSMDLSYWGSRRLRVIPLWNKKEPVCQAATSAARSVTSTGDPSSARTSAAP
ncbi:hypothetical protein [Sphingomonas immobilis]|uniref:Lipoprotein n=1 Tax=Sphingomonas immobilis TaxID=3063997 RepID=A0ABT9A1A3_9SPHN|nr:hypothetical protein [Sphingomonas sp. CA1-15]MDO7843035.1 hypothetical protein [Sphingomonas sp. CA1-15]